MQEAHIYNDYISGKNHNKPILNYFLDNMNMKNAIGTASFSIVYNSLPEPVGVANKVIISKIASDLTSGYCSFSLEYAWSISETVAYSFLHLALQVYQPNLYRDHPIKMGLATALFSEAIDSAGYTYEWMMGETTKMEAEL